MKKKILSVLLCLMMLLSLMPMSSFADISKVTSISFSGLVGPVIGEKPVKTVNSLSNNYSVRVVMWLKIFDDEATEMNADEVFEEGQKYCALLRAETTDGCEFSNVPDEMEIEPVNCSLPSDYRVGGLTYHYDSNSGHDIYMITLMFDSAMSVSGEKISEVKLDSVVFPEIGKTPSRSVNSLNKDAYFVSLVGWIEEGKQALMGSDDEFKAGKTYHALFNLSIEDGYRFDIPDNLTLTLNGKKIASDATFFSLIGENGLNRMVSVKFDKLPAIKFEDLPETGVTGITLSADWTDVAEDGAVIKNAFVQYCKDNNIQTDENGIALIDYVSYWGGSATYHKWIITIQGDTVTAEDGGLSNLAAILAAVNDPNPIYDWWINGTYTNDSEPDEFPFTDVKTSDWSYDDIYYVWEKGLMKGTSDITFAPKKNTSRAMIVTILWRLEGAPVVNSAMSFKDVTPDQCYTEAVRWAQANGIVNGYSAETFGTNDPITREQMAAILYRYADFKGYDVSAKANLTKFADSGKISGWALDAIAWANANNLVNGVSSIELDPQGYAKREQVAAILHRFCENVVK